MPIIRDKLAIFLVAFVLSFVVGVFIALHFPYKVLIVIDEPGWYETRWASGFPLQWCITGFEIFWVYWKNLLLDIIFWSFIALPISSIISWLGKRHITINRKAKYYFIGGCLSFIGMDIVSLVHLWLISRPKFFVPSYPWANSLIVILMFTGIIMLIYGTVTTYRKPLRQKEKLEENTREERTVQP